MGGHDGHSRLRATEVYCPEKNQWTLLANMMVRRSDADASEVDGKIYIFGLFSCQHAFTKWNGFFFSQVGSTAVYAWEAVKSTMSHRISGHSYQVFATCWQWIQLLLISNIAQICKVHDLVWNVWHIKIKFMYAVDIMAKAGWVRAKHSIQV